MGTLRPVRLSRVVAAGPSGSGKRAPRLRGGDRGVCAGLVLPAERQFRPLHAHLHPVPCPALPCPPTLSGNLDLSDLGAPCMLQLLAWLPLLAIPPWERPGCWPCIISRTCTEWVGSLWPPSPYGARRDNSIQSGQQMARRQRR